MNKRQSSSEPRCIKILVDKDKFKINDITFTSQLDRESTIYFLKVCLKELMERTSLNGSTNGKGKER